MILFDEPRHGVIIADEVGVPFHPGRDHTIARERNGKILGGVIYSDFTGASVCMHVAGFDPKWINRDMLWVCFHYPFVQLGVSKIFAKVEATNAQALEFDRKLGFNVEARIPGVFSSGDLVILSMCRPACRWLRLQPRLLVANRHEQEVQD